MQVSNCTTTLCFALFCILHIHSLAHHHQSYFVVVFIACGTSGSYCGSGFAFVRSAFEQTANRCHVSIVFFFPYVPIIACPGVFINYPECPPLSAFADVDMTAVIGTVVNKTSFPLSNYVIHVMMKHTPFFSMISVCCTLLCFFFSFLPPPPPLR